jgi:hypothetical protein
MPWPTSPKPPRSVKIDERDGSLIFETNHRKHLLRNTQAIMPGDFFGQSSQSDPVPFTLFPPTHQVTVRYLANFRASLNVDDYLYSGFLAHGVFRYQDQVVPCDDDANKLIYQWRTISLWLKESDDRCRDLLAGPYVAYNGKIWEAWGLYEDHECAMAASFKPAVAMAVSLGTANPTLRVHPFRRSDLNVRHI